jgi:hypothetical protein
MSNWKLFVSMIFVLHFIISIMVDIVVMDGYRSDWKETIPVKLILTVCAATLLFTVTVLFDIHWV